MKSISDVINQKSLKILQKDYAENKTGRGVVFFVGSGLSRASGLPDWASLSENLSSECKISVELNQFSEAKLKPIYIRMESEKNLWKKFSLIKEILGETTFFAHIKYLLSTEGKSIPNSYARLMELNVQGFVSLNIDDFLIRSAHEKGEKVVYPVYGKGSEEKLPELVKQKPFIYQPHGSITSESSWVFTEDDFNKLIESPLHDQFISSIFLRDIVVFIGITASDVGASLRLMKLNERNLKNRAHFWITTTSHLEDREWAERNGIQQILYPSELGHENCISAIIDSIKKAESRDDVINKPITGLKVNSDVLSKFPSPSELFKFDDIDQIRLTLNKIINSSSENGEISYENYQTICREYARAIHSCYMMPSGEAGEYWFGYKITGKPLGGKTIGRVMPGMEASGKNVAIKILDQRRYSDELYLSAFRRGVKALEILSKGEVNGTVKVYDAYEVPPTIVMDYINCASLEDAVSAQVIGSKDIFQVMRDVSTIILHAHLLPETVLHRDIRPSNLLLEDFDWVEGTFGDVKVIDFDLAWHKGALGDDFIRSDRDSLGFQAPEQLAKGDAAQRRTTLIDSYGIGATLFFCLSRTPPALGLHKDAAWPEQVLQHARLRLRGNPEVTKFVADIVTSSMAHDVSERISVSEINSRLSDLVNWLESNLNNCSNDFLAEMVCALSAVTEYNSEKRRKRFEFHTYSGLTTTIYFDFLDSNFVIEFEYLKPKNIDNQRADKVLDKLKSNFHTYFHEIKPERCSFLFTGSRQFAAKVTVGRDFVEKSPLKVSYCIKKFYQDLNIQ